MTFDGIPAEAGAFLRRLATHNERAWFTEHKATYQAAVLAPMRTLVAALAPAMAAIDPAFDLDPRGAAVSRIHRDTRFARDKSPYRTNQWIAFKHRAKDWPNRPAYFMEFGPDRYRYGMGFYAATPSTMAAIRAHIAARPSRFLDAMAEARQAGFGLEGDEYKRPRAAADQPAAIQDWFRRKNAYLVRNEAVETLFDDPALPERLIAAFTAAAPLYRFLAEL